MGIACGVVSPAVPPLSSPLFYNTRDAHNESLTPPRTLVHLFFSVYIEDLVADALQVVHIQCVEVLPPPGAGLGVGGRHKVKLGELARQVDECYRYCLRFPLQTEAGTETVCVERERERIE